MSVYCQYAVLNFHWTPKQFAELPSREKAFVIACIDNRVDAEQRELAKAKSKK